MSKKIAGIIFTLYQGFFASANATCRFRPTCSQYALDAIDKFGLIKGGLLMIRRVLSCHPFTKRPIYDPI